MNLDMNLKNLTAARLDERGGVLIMVLEFKPNAQDTITLEIAPDMLKTMFKILYAMAQRGGEIQPIQRAITDVPLSDVVLLPVEEIETRTTPQGALWLVSRTGLLDTAMAFPDRRAARLLGQALLKTK